MKLNIKPLSVNLAWQGRRYRTDAYRKFQKDLTLLLPSLTLPDPPYKISFVFGFSNNASDLDNPLKCVQDIIAAKYGFNDKLITELNIKKEVVSKGEEFIKFEIIRAV